MTMLAARRLCDLIIQHNGCGRIREFQPSRFCSAMRNEEKKIHAGEENILNSKAVVLLLFCRFLLLFRSGRFESASSIAPRDIQYIITISIAWERS